MTRLKILVYFMLSASMAFAYSSNQIIPSNIQSPNASSLGQYGNIPVSYHTGRADISIPLFETTVRGMPFKMTLDYDTSGMLMNSLPSWTGYNWTLNAGGVIVRTVMNRADEYVIPKHVYSAKQTYNYFQSYDYLPTHMYNSGLLQDTVFYGTRDMSPDIFTFHFMGISGKFFLGNDGQWKVLCDQNVEVLFDISDASNYDYPLFEKFPLYVNSMPPSNAEEFYQPKTIKGFKIRDEEGNVYEFGGVKDAIEYSTYFFRAGDREQEVAWLADSWYLSNVKDRFGNLLYHFTYSRGCYIAQFYNILEFCENYNSAHSIFGKYGQYLPLTNLKFPYVGYLKVPVYLSSINCSNGISISFDKDYTPLTPETLYYNMFSRHMLPYNLNSLPPFDPSCIYPYYYLQSPDAAVAKYQYKHSGEDLMSNALAATKLSCLSYIFIRDVTQKHRQIYRFSYNFTNRMHLEKLELYHAPYKEKFSENANHAYTFKYNDFGNMPTDCTTNAVDHWGYYRGSSYSYPADGNFAVFKSQRDPNAASLQKGMLNTIVYPTGGVSVLEYEPHTFSKYLSADRQSMKDSVSIAGGLRIKSVAEYEDTTCTKLLRLRTFDYSIPGTTVSSGQLFAAPCYYWKNWKANPAGNNAVSTVTLFRSSSIIPLFNSFGPHVGYSYVREIESDGSSTSYHYSNFSDYKDDRFFLSYSESLSSPYDRFSERGYQRGRLLRLEKYDKNGAKTHSTGYQYRTGGEMKYVYTTNLEYVNTGKSSSFSYFIGGIYKLFYPKYDIVQTTDTAFTANGIVADQTDYTRHDYMLSLSQPYEHKTDIRYCSFEKTSRKGESTVTNYTYPFLSDFTIDQELSSKWFYLKPVATELEGRSMQRMLFKNITINGSLQPAPSYLTETFPGVSGVGNVTDTIVSYGYTPSGQLSFYHEKGKPSVHLYYGYNDNYLIARGNTPNFNPELYLSGNDMFDETKQQVFLNYLKSKISSTSCFTAYTWQPLLGITSMLDPLGNVTYYVYDKFFRLTDIKNEEKQTIKHYEYRYRIK